MKEWWEDKDWCAEQWRILASAEDLKGNKEFRRSFNKRVKEQKQNPEVPRIYRTIRVARREV